MISSSCALGTYIVDDDRLIRQAITDFYDQWMSWLTRKRFVDLHVLEIRRHLRRAVVYTSDFDPNSSARSRQPSRSSCPSGKLQVRFSRARLVRTSTMEFQYRNRESS